MKANRCAECRYYVRENGTCQTRKASGASPYPTARDRRLCGFGRRPGEMTLDEAIAHSREKAAELEGTKCGREHALLARWLEDYRERLMEEGRNGNGKS